MIERLVSRGASAIAAATAPICSIPTPWIAGARRVRTAPSRNENTRCSGDSAVLAALEEFGPLSQADLGRLLGLDRSDVNGIVGRLEAASSLTRQPDPADRRRNIVAITDGGRVRVAELFEQATEVQAELLVALTPAERDQLTGLLAKVLRGHAPQPA